MNRHSGFFILIFCLSKLCSTGILGSEKFNDERGILADFVKIVRSQIISLFFDSGHGFLGCFVISEVKVSYLLKRIKSDGTGQRPI